MKEIIKQTIIQKGTPISFDEFMNLALYHPKSGYYRVAWQKFGQKGDFITAPELSPLFAQCLSRQVKQCLKKDNSILEFGAGSGLLAGQLLQALELNKSLPSTYYLLELSGELKARQRETISKMVPHLLKHCVWLQSLPSQFKGVVIANEVLDAMPCKRFKFTQQQWCELLVDYQDDQFVWCEQKTQKPLNFTPTEGYQTEVNYFHQPWLKALYDTIDEAVILLIDYGYTANEYYHPKRTQGTLRCYYQHQANDDPFIHIGKQDITSSVNFSNLYHSALALGFWHFGFTTQAHFLMNLGIAGLIESYHQQAQVKFAQQIKQLILPNAMGETFKVIALGKMNKTEIDKQGLLKGFSFGDLTHKLS